MKKNIKRVITPMLALTTLAPIPMVITACNQNSSTIRKLTFINGYTDEERAQIGSAAYKVSTSEFNPSKENTIKITFDKYSELYKVTSRKQFFEIFPTNPWGRTDDGLVEGQDYTVENPTMHEFIIKFNAEQSKKINRNMSIRFKACYKSIKLGVDIKDTEDPLDKSLDDWWGYNNYVNSDFSFLLVPRHLESGYEVNESVINNIKIYGIAKDGKQTLLNDSATSGVKIEKSLAYMKMQGSSEPEPTQSHYMKVSIPMNKLYDIDDKENFTAKYVRVGVKGDSYCDVHAGMQFGRKFIFKPTNCYLVNENYGWNEWTFQTKKETGICYVAKFKATSGKFNFDYSGRTKLPITSLRVQPRNDLFKTISFNSVEDLLTSYFLTTTSETEFDYFLNWGDVVPNLENWLEFDVSNDQTELTVRVIIERMCKYTQMPTLSITSYEKLSSYTGGSIDFLDYLSMDIKPDAE